MANLLGANIGTNYKGFLNIGTAINTPLDSTLRPITDGMGNSSALFLNNAKVSIISSLGINTAFWSDALDVNGNFSLHNDATGIDRITFSNGPQIEANGPVGYFKSGNVYTNTMGSGNVGIGISNPTHKLEVLGNLKIGLANGSVERLWTSGGPTISYDPIASVFEFGGGYINVDTANGIVNMQYSPVVIGAALSHPSAKLEVVSTTQGVLFPRMTTTQKNAISSPAAGLVIYDTTLGKLCVRGASAWQTITSV